MKAIGYVRVSTEEQTNGVSLEAQEAKIRAWCTLHDAELVAIYRDEGISGYKGRDCRPGLDTGTQTGVQGERLPGGLQLVSTGQEYTGND